MLVVMGVFLSRRRNIPVSSNIILWGDLLWYRNDAKKKYFPKSLRYVV